MKSLLLSIVLFISGLFAKDYSMEKPLIVTTISPYNHFIQRIVGEKYEVLCIIPQSKNPHLFEPTTKQMQKIAKATIWFSMGESFENQISPAIKRANPKIQMIDLCDDLDLIADSHHKKAQDRHVWLSPKILQKQLISITKILNKTFSDDEKRFEKNLTQIIAELKNLDAELTTMLSDLKNKAVLVTHPDFTYFCKDYELEQLPIEKFGNSPTGKLLQNYLNKIKTKNIKLIFHQPQYSDIGAKALSKQTKLPIIIIDPFSSDYTHNLLSFARSLKESYVTSP